MGNHTVEKIGGTSMSRFGELMNNVIIGSRSKAEYYNRIFVVSAYGGITNLLLEDKKTGEPGVYGRFAAEEDWQEALETVREKMIEYKKILDNGSNLSAGQKQRIEFFFCHRV